MISKPTLILEALFKHAESVTELIKTESQQIQLIVNEQDKKLRMETI
jgi:phosphotransferase system IIB component